MLAGAAGAAWAPPVAVGLLAALFAFGASRGLDIAPIYGAGMVLVGELIAHPRWLEGAGRQVAALLATASFGGLLAALALAAASIGVRRSLLPTVLGAIAILGAGATLARLGGTASSRNRRDHASVNQQDGSP